MKYEKNLSDTMKDPHLYSEVNLMQRRDNENFLKEFSHLCHWDKNESVLDIGTGSGDVLIDIVLPLLRRNYCRLVGTDMSKDMVEFAAERYKKYDKVSFVQQDIESPTEECVKKLGHFNHVISFYCLHWVQNQRLAFGNIFKLLRPGGECLVLFLVRHPFFEIYKILAKQPRWQPYSKNYRRAISPYNDSQSPVDDLKNVMASVGFKQIIINLKDRSFDYEDTKGFKDFVDAVNPFSAQIPTKELHREFLLEFLKLTTNMGMVTASDENERKIKIRNNYTLLAAYGQKPKYHK